MQRDSSQQLHYCNRESLESGASLKAQVGRSNFQQYGVASANRTTSIPAIGGDSVLKC
jgi:hypothetical protein